MAGCAIAQLCLQDGQALPAKDCDFERIAALTGLQLIISAQFKFTTNFIAASARMYCATVEFDMFLSCDSTHVNAL
jgi:hypothetical protein